MLDHFGPEVSKGRVRLRRNCKFREAQCLLSRTAASLRCQIEDPDEFPVGWHPHKGQDVLTYLIEGVGRHADSLGNRGEFTAPGLQWMATGSGVEHAEGGGTPAGQRMEGFQIWVRTTSAVVAAAAAAAAAAMIAGLSGLAAPSCQRVVNQCIAEAMTTPVAPLCVFCMGR
jgi:redox-sensitive bicupin YhaK (pirin superfamily)